MLLKEVVDLNKIEESKGIKFLIKGQVYQISGESEDGTLVLLTRIYDNADIPMDKKSFSVLVTYCEVYQTQYERMN